MTSQSFELYRAKRPVLADLAVFGEQYAYSDTAGCLIELRRVVEQAVQADGFSLDDKRDPTKENDLPDALARWTAKDAKMDADRGAKHVMVPVKDIEAKEFDLSMNRYKETKLAEVEFESPRAILAKLRKREKEIAQGIDELERML